MGDLFFLFTGQGIEGSCFFWDQIYISLKFIKWVIGEGNWKSFRFFRCIVLRVQLCFLVTFGVDFIVGIRSRVD